MTTLTASEAAAALGCSRRWLRELVHRGVLVIVDKGGGRGKQTTYRIWEHWRKARGIEWTKEAAK